MSEITHGGLFSGIGGFGLGFQWAGIKTIWDVDIEPYSQQSLKINFPETEIFGDIREVGKHNLRSVDIISGGFPCQPFSNAGKRGGEADNRYLWPEMLRVIQELRPAWVVCENVAGLESMGFAIEDVKVASRSITRYADQDHYEGIYTLKERMYLDFICEQLEESGYDVQPFNIPACGVGAPHLRRRIWIVAHARCEHGEQGNASGVEFDEAKRSARPIQPESSSEGCAGTLSDSSAGNDGSGDAGAPGRQISESGKSSGAENVADSKGPDSRDVSQNIGKGCGEVDTSIDPSSTGGGNDKSSNRQNVADTPSVRREGDGGFCAGKHRGSGEEKGPHATDGGADVCDSPSQRSSVRTEEQMGESGSVPKFERPAWWAVEPNLGELVDGLPAELAAQFAGRDLPRDMPIPRVAKGIPDRADKLKGFGNAVIPEIPEMFGRIIAEIINQGESNAT